MRPTKHENELIVALSDKYYYSISIDEVVEDKEANEILILYDIKYNTQNTQNLIREILFAKEEVESYLKDHQKDYSQIRISMSFVANYDETSVSISNYNKYNGAGFENCYDMHYGRFTCNNASLLDFQDVEDFEILCLRGFRDYSDVSALDSMNNLTHLQIHCGSYDISSIDTEYLKKKHPDCTIEIK